jgi:hypothetical protein
MKNLTRELKLEMLIPIKRLLVVSEGTWTNKCISSFALWTLRYTKWSMSSQRHSCRVTKGKIKMYSAITPGGCSVCQQSIGTWATQRGSGPTCNWQVDLQVCGFEFSYLVTEEKIF